VKKVFGELKQKYGAEGSLKIPLTAVAAVYNPIAKTQGWPTLPPLKAGIPVPSLSNAQFPVKEWRRQA
jgi:hypothetical protein